MREGGSLLAIVEAHQDDVDEYYKAVQRASGFDRMFWDEELSAWVFTGYIECAVLLKSQSLTRARLILSSDPLYAELIEFVQSILDNQTIFASKPSAVVRRKSWSRVLNPPECGDVTRDLQEIAARSILGAAVSSGGRFCTKFR